MTVELPDDFASACQWADAYRALRLAVIPAAGREKIPVGKWREFQTGIPQTIHERWYGDDGEHRANYRMGFLTGAASLGDGWKLLVIDLDEKGTVSGSATWDHWIADNELGCDPETWRARTGGGGQHIYFRYPAHLSIRNTQETIAGIDVRAEGGFVIAPPSRHQNGKQYLWIFSPFDTDLAEAPQWLLDKVGASEALPLASAPVPAPSRDLRTAPARESPPGQATDAWGHIIDGRDAYMRDMVWAAIVDWYRECPIRPTAPEVEQKLLEVYAVYERKVRPQEAGNTLEGEGRGLSAFREKWAYAMRQWDTKVAAAAARDAHSLFYDLQIERPQQSAAIRTVDFVTLLNEVVEDEPDYITPDFAGPGNFVLIAGPPKAQKSFLLQEMLVAAATGGPFLAGLFRAPRPLKVFYLQAEMNRKLLRKRAREMRFLSEHDRELLATNLVLSERFFMLLNEDGVRMAVNVIKDAFPDDPPDIIAIDPLANVFDQDNENDAAQIMRFVTGRLEAIRQSVNPDACLVLVHHATKKTREDMERDPFVAIRGSGALRGHYDSAIVIFRASEEGAERKVHFELRGGESPEPMTVQLSNGRFVKSDSMPSITKPVAREILAAIDAAWKRDAPWSPHARARPEGRYVCDNAAHMFNVSAKEVDILVKHWLANAIVTYRPAVSRRRPAGLEKTGSLD